MADPEVPKVASDTLSQLVARVLSQLSLSAWLPSAFLVLMFAFLFRLGTAADAHPSEPVTAVGLAFSRLGNTPPRAIVLMVAAVVVLTMLTQSFAFGAIRFLEGYWGTSDAAKAAADWRASIHQAKKGVLEKRVEDARTRGWAAAQTEIRKSWADDHRHLRKGRMLAHLESKVLHHSVPRKLRPLEKAVVDDLDWRAYAPADVLREIERLDRRLDDYPDDQNIQPTALGNTLRHFEDELETDDVETFVQRVWEYMPFETQIAHDEQRSRLDLYCSMTFSWLVVLLASLVRFGVELWIYSLSSAAIALVGCAVTYLAAKASARYYGQVLLTMSDTYSRLESASP